MWVNTNTLTWELIGTVMWVNTNTLLWELIGTVMWVYTNKPTWELNRYRQTRPDQTRRHLNLPLLLLLLRGGTSPQTPPTRCWVLADYSCSCTPSTSRAMRLRPVLENCSKLLTTDKEPWFDSSTASSLAAAHGAHS